MQLINHSSSSSNQRLYQIYKKTNRHNGQTHNYAISFRQYICVYVFVNKLLQLINQSSRSSNQRLYQQYEDNV